MRVIAAIIAVMAIATVAGSATWVVTKEDSPALAVRVEGVPGYVYYHQQYPLTVHYSNDGGAVSGPMELSVQLPETFALADHIADPTRHGERLVWQLDGLDAGEQGSVSFAVQGTLPADLTKAVYDLPGYVGHTAFEEGFQMAAALRGGGASTDALAVADTGEITDTIVVHKDCDPDDNALGEFEITLFNDDDQVEGVETIGCNENAEFEGLLPIDGPFYAEETDTADGFTETGNTCDGLDPGPAETPTMCEIENTETEETGTIIITKDVDPEPDGTNFTFTDNIPGCSIGILDDDGAGATPNSVTCTDVDPGDYEVTESASSYTLTDITCSDTNSVGDEASRTAFIDLSAGETVECVFNNIPGEETGTIIIEKDVDPEPDGTNFSFNDNIPGCAIGTLDDDGAGATPNSVTCTDVLPGDYLVSEDNPSPYSLVSIVCNDLDDDTTVSGSTAFIDLDAGETVTCVFKNTPPAQQGSITITKDTDPETDGPAFDFDSPFGDFDLEDDGVKTFTGLAGGVYVVTENLPSGWTVIDIDCTDNDSNRTGSSAFIQLAPGEHVTCEFRNRAPEAPKPPAPKPTKVPATVGPIVAPPSAGDAGLADSSDGLSWVVGVMAIVAASATAWVLLQRLLIRSRRG